MYGPKERVTVHLFLFGSMVLFVGALVLPLLIEEDLVRTQFGSDPGFQVQGGAAGDDAPPSLLDARMRPPSTAISSPARAENTSFLVHWDSIGSDPMFVYGYHAQYRVEGDGEGDWQDWFGHRRSDLPRAARFTGEPDTGYTFRVRACTLDLDCGGWSTDTATRVSPDAEASWVRLDLTPLGPAPEESVSGHTAIRWSYDHRGPGDVMVGVTLRLAGGDEAVPLYSGQGGSVAWDTTRYPDGTHVLRFEVRDGIHVLSELLPVTIANGSP